MAVEPITPDDIAGQKRESFPDEVFEAFNEIIAANCVNGRSCFTQDAVVRLMISKGLEIDEIIAKHWLDVEEVYRKAGWKVGYDKPGYNEDYSANFTFTAKK